MSKVYIGHIGEHDAERVLQIARSVGTVISHTPPRISKSAKHARYSAGWGMEDHIGLNKEYAYYMLVVMQNKDQAQDLITSIGMAKWDIEYNYGVHSMCSEEEPRTYAEFCKS